MDSQRKIALYDAYRRLSLQTWRLREIATQWNYIGILNFVLFMGSFGILHEGIALQMSANTDLDPFWTCALLITFPFLISGCMYLYAWVQYTRSTRIEKQLDAI